MILLDNIVCSFANQLRLNLSLLPFPPIFSVIMDIQIDQPFGFTF